MPELPEVETVKRGLKKFLIGKVVESVKFDWPKSFPNAKNDVDAFLIGSEIINVRRRAKVLMIDLSTQYSLVVHLKMTGQLVYRASNTKDAFLTKHRIATGVDDQNFGAGHPNKSLVGELPDRSTRVQLKFEDGSVLFFNDQRKFGWMKMVPTTEIENLPFFQKLGPEPLVDTFTTAEFRKRLKRRKNSMAKAVLLDQSVIAGVGNIYADEALFGAKVHPLTKIVDIPKSQLDELYSVLRDVLKISIAAGGSTDKNYVNAEGKSGSYLTFAKVFRREGEPCVVCSNEIIKIRAAGRGTHICPVCQVQP